jgi:hypothetical protein
MGTRATCGHSCSRRSSHCRVARARAKLERSRLCRRSSFPLQAPCSSRALMRRHPTRHHTAITSPYLQHLSAPTCLCAVIHPSRRPRTWRRRTRRSLRRPLCGTSGNPAQPPYIPPSDPSTQTHGNRALHSRAMGSITINNKYMDSKLMASNTMDHRTLGSVRSSTAQSLSHGLRRTFPRHRP